MECSKSFTSLNSRASWRMLRFRLERSSDSRPILVNPTNTSKSGVSRHPNSPHHVVRAIGIESFRALLASYLHDMTTGKKLALGCFVGIPLVCCLGGLLFTQLATGQTETELKRELRITRDAGIPTEESDYEKMTSVPDAQNAERPYLEIFKGMGEKTQVHKDLIALQNGMSKRAKAKEVSAANEAFVRLGPLLEKVRPLSEIPHLHFHRDISQGALLQIPEPSNLKYLGKLLLFSALRKDKDGDLKGAIADLGHAEKIANQLGEDPILIGFLLSLSLHLSVEQTMVKMLSRHNTDSSALTLLKNWHDHANHLPNFRRCLIGELVMGRITLHNLKSLTELTAMGGSGEEQKVPSPFEKAIIGSPIVKTTFDVKLVRGYRSMILKTPDDPAKWSEASRVGKEQDQELQNDHSLTNIFNEIFMPVFYEAPKSIGELIARRRLTDCSLRLLLGQCQSGKLPKFLPNWGEASMDPFSGRPLSYHPKGHGFLLYSFGRDEVDNGGKEVDTTNSSKGYDDVVLIK